MTPAATKSKAKSKAKTKKTFCKMCPKWEIKRPERCSNTVKRKAGTVYFCTARCKERFLKAEAA